MYLNCHTYFSLRYGTLSPEELAQQAAALHIDTLVITDINNSTSTFAFVKACQEHNITPLVGIEFRHKNTPLFTGIAKNNEGFRELNQFLSEHILNKKKLPELAPPLAHCVIVYPFGKCQPDQLAAHEFTGIRPQELTRLITSPYRQHQKNSLCGNRSLLKTGLAMNYTATCAPLTTTSY